VQYALEYVYGYRCEDSRMNAYFNASGDAVYMTAALGVVLNTKTNTQKFFGGGSVEQKAKNVSDDMNSHTDDITSLTISSDRQWVATGQVGSSPAVFVWNAKTCQKKQRIKLTKGARGVDAIAISADGTHVAFTDRNDQHNVHLYEISSG
jgi:microtubule-associated protein-like 6